MDVLGKRFVHEPPPHGEKLSLRHTLKYARPRRHENYKLAQDALASWKKTAEKTQLLKWTDIKEEKLNDKITRKLAVGQNEMVGRLWLAEGAVVPPHRHVSEQITMVISGALMFTIDGKEVTVRAGEVLVIPPNFVHSALALEDTDDIDSFSPLREDWLTGDDAYLKTGKSTLK
jgi:quercetin dioxygenase-like cupin family protein